MKKTFDFNQVEKIREVEGYIITKNISISNVANVTKSFITGIQFISTEDHATHLKMIVKLMI